MNVNMVVLWHLKTLHTCELNPVSFLHWQDEQLRALVRQFGQQDWKFLASHFPVSIFPQARACCSVLRKQK